MTTAMFFYGTLCHAPLREAGTGPLILSMLWLEANRARLGQG